MSANTTQRNDPPTSESAPASSPPQQSASSPPASPGPQQPTSSSPPSPQPSSPNQATPPSSPPPAAGASTPTRPTEAPTQGVTPTASSVPPVTVPTTPSTASPSPPTPTSSSSHSSSDHANSSPTASTAPPAVTTTSSSGASSTSQPNAPSSSTITVVNGGSTSIRVVTATSTTQLAGGAASSSGTSGSTSTATPIDPSAGSSSGLSQPAKVAIGVVVPIAAIALLAVVGLFWWRKRRARQQAEEERRKEVEDYAYNPNHDPTMPSVGRSPDTPYEMREDGGSKSGYRGWGPSTAAGAGSMGRKTSTTMSAGMAGVAHSDGHSPTRANGSEARSAEPLLDGSPASSPEHEALGTMGPSAAHNRAAAAGDVHRGPSNASSSYSAAARSDGSDSGLYTNTNAYYDQYGQNPYTDHAPPADHAGQAVIRDNPARRNTRIENPAHYPQQSAGISQNF